MFRDGLLKGFCTGNDSRAVPLGEPDDSANFQPEQFSVSGTTPWGSPRELHTFRSLISVCVLSGRRNAGVMQGDSSVKSSGNTSRDFYFSLGCDKIARVSSVTCARHKTSH